MRPCQRLHSSVTTCGSASSVAKCAGDWCGTCLSQWMPAREQVLEGECRARTAARESTAAIGVVSAHIEIVNM